MTAAPAGAPRPRRRRWRVAVAVLAALLASAAALGAAVLPRGVDPVGPDGRPRELVVLVHGMGRTPLSMALLARRLEDDGYRVLNHGYSSYDDSIPALAAALADEVAREAGPAPRVHFVGHSLGNVLIRWTMTYRPPARPGRVVMLAPPNRGSTSADRYAPYVAWLMPPIEGLRTDPAATVHRIPVAPRMEFAVIAGAHDGKVSVAETRLAGQRDHLVVPAAHTFLMNREDVHAQVLSFLRTGAFAR